MAEGSVEHQCYECSAGDESSILSILRNFLPYSIHVYRRIQSVHRSKSARIISTLSPNQLSEFSALAEEPAFCFAVAFVDRSARPETESLIFLRSEVPNTCP